MGRRGAIVLDMSAMFMMYLPVRWQCLHFYVLRVREAVTRAHNLGFNVVTCRLTADRVRQQILAICQVAAWQFQIYEKGCTGAATCEGFLDYVEQMRKEAARRRNQQPASPLDKRGETERILALLLVYGRLLRDTWVQSNVPRRLRYADLKEGFAALAERGRDPHPPGDVLTTGPGPCEPVPGRPARSKTRRRSASRKDCQSRQLLESLLERWGVGLQHQARRCLEQIEKDLKLMLAESARRLGQRETPTFEGGIVQRISALASECFRFASLRPEDDLLVAIKAWAWEKWRTAQCLRLILEVRLDCQNKVPCLCRHVTVVTLALATLRKWAGAGLFLPDVQGGDGLFSFDRRLSFCAPLRIERHAMHQGVECRRDRHDPSRQPIGLKLGNKWLNRRLIDRMPAHQGFAVQADGLKLPPYEDALLTRIRSWTGPRPYVALPSAPERLVLRHLFDTSEDPVQVILGEA